MNNWSLRISILQLNEIKNLAHITIGDEKRVKQTFRILKNNSITISESKANIELIDPNNDIVDDFPTSLHHAKEIASHFKLRIKFLNT